MLKNEPTLAIVAVDTEENERLRFEVNFSVYSFTSLVLFTLAADTTCRSSAGWVPFFFQGPRSARAGVDLPEAPEFLEVHHEGEKLGEVHLKPAVPRERWLRVTALKFTRSSFSIKTSKWIHFPLKIGV